MVTCCFNSIMGRLKANNQGKRGRPKDPFQFHNGSIKREKADLYIKPRIRFQFHNGSIKSGSPIGMRSSKRTSFNSTMVRLEVDPARCHGSDSTVSIPLWDD